MKICILSEYLSYVGGGERVYCHWANLFTEKLGYEVTIVAMEQGVRPFFQLAPSVKVTSLSLRKEYFYKNSKVRKILMVLRYFTDRRKIQNYFKRCHYDVILGIATNINLLLSTIKINGIKVATEHTEYYAPNFVIRFFRKLLYKNFDAVTVLNEDDKNHFKKINTSTWVMLNPVDFCPNDKVICDYSKHKLITIGSLSPQKNQSQMIEAMTYIHKRYPEWSLDIYGQGPLYGYLQQYIEKNNAEGYVKLQGATNDIYSKLCEASIFLLSSSIEGFGLVLVEAMSTGLACVCFQTSGTKMVVKNEETGFVIPMGNIRLFIEKVCELIEDSEKREKMGKNALNSIQKYSFDSVASDWKELLEHLIRLKHENNTFCR